MSGKPKPLVSVGIPTFNGAHRIEKALSSLLVQDYPNLEIIISDNASLDNTREICESYARNDHRINYHRQSRNLGLMPNFEYLLHVAKGQYFIFLSDDDAFEPGILGKYVDFLEKHPDHSMVCGQVIYWNGETIQDCESGISIRQKSPMIRALSLYSSAKMAGLIHGMFRREIGNKLRLKSILGNDWHFIAALAFKGKIHQLDEVGYQKSADGSSSNFHKYVRSMGENPLWAYFPFGKIALDAFREILYKEKAYQVVAMPIRLLSATFASLAILFHYYVNIKSKMLIGRIMRAFNIRTPRERKLARQEAQYFQLEKETV